MEAMKIWAHRGCSQRYPENTLLAFEKAAALKGLAGIELDIQLTRDGELVVIHDERVDRTTEGIGYVRDYTLSQLRKLHIYAGDNPSQTIPTMEEVFDLLEKYMKWDFGKQTEYKAEAESKSEAEFKSGAELKSKTGYRSGAEHKSETEYRSETGHKSEAALRLNIELKNSIVPYQGMEEKIVRMVQERGLQDRIVYSTFYAKSLARMKALDSGGELAILDTKASDCVYKLKGGCGAAAIHPFWKAIDLAAEELEGITVRAWMSGHLYPEKPTGTRLEFEPLERKGITDIILNEPEAYLL